MEHRPEISCLNSEELASQAQAGSAECFAELVNRHSETLFNFLYRKVANRHDAEDLAQETFARAYRRLDLYQPRYRFATWLFTIGFRLACTFHRDRKASMELPEEGLVDSLAGRPVITVGERDDLWEKIGEVLSANQSRVLWLRYGEGLSVAEIAKETGKSVSHVKVLLHRARMRLVQCLKKEDWMAGGVQ